MRKGRRKRKACNDLPKFTEVCKIGKKKLLGYINCEQRKIPVYQSSIKIPTIDL